MIQNSNEFLGLPNDASTNLHRRRVSYRAYNQYQSPRVVVMNPETFLRRNNSGSKNEICPEFKLSARSGKNKPLSLMSSMKKFEIEPDDILKKDSNLFNPKNLLKSKSRER